MEFRKQIGALERHYGPREAQRFRDPLHWVLWENVLYLADDADRAAAFRALRKRIGLTPDEILAACDRELLEVTSTGGILPRLQAEKLRKIAAIARDRFGGDLRPILKKPLREAIRDLKRFPAIGEPGAEKILLFMRAAPIMALESNGLRVLARLGYAQEQKSYAAMYRNVRAALAPQLPGDCDSLIRAYELLRHHGKATCRRSNPACPECPLKKGCGFYKQTSASS